MSAWYLRLLPCQSCHKGPTWTAPWICVYFFRWGRNQKAAASLWTQTEGKACQVIGERLTRHPGDIHTDRRAASVFMRWSITSISFLRPPGCVKWAVWEQTHGKLLRNSINIHKIFLDKLISNYLENAVLFFVCQSMVLFNVPTFFFYFPFCLLFSDDMKHDSTVSVFSVGFFSFFPCSAHFGPVWILEIHAEMPLRQMHRHTIKTSL